MMKGSMTVICPECGKEIEDGAFCAECGAKLDLPAEPEVRRACPDHNPAIPVSDDGKWPRIIPVLLLIAAAMALLAQGFGLIRIVRSGTPFEMITRTYWDFWFLAAFPAAGAVLFFFRTKKAAFVTAFPYLIYAIPAVIRYSNLIDLAELTGRLTLRHLTFGGLFEIVSYYAVLIPVLLAAVYLLGMLIKTRPPVFAVIYIATAAVMIGIAAASDVRAVINTVTAIRMDVSPWTNPGVTIPARTYIAEYFSRPYIWDTLYRFFRFLLAVFTHIACVLALFAKHGRKNA